MVNTQMMTLAHAANFTQGHTLHPTVAFERVITDSRAVQAGDLFVALQGENFDGHAFVERAFQTGAVAVLVNHVPQDTNIPYILVKDTLAALGQLAAAWRQQCAPYVLAITGSNGKTTVKEMVAALLRTVYGADRVLATQGNLNNHIGVPLTLLQLRPEHRYAVIEMGMNHLGELAQLTQLAQPDAALINNAHQAHLGELGSLDNIALAKSEIFNGLNEKGVAVFPADSPYTALWQTRATHCRQRTFGQQIGDWQGEWGQTQLQLHKPFASTLSLSALGAHNAHNALAALTLTADLNLPPIMMQQALAHFCNAKGRLQRLAGLHGAFVVDDSYNANPDSMQAALRVLATLPQRHKIFVMGDIGELGAFAPQLHAELGVFARSCGLSALYTLGEHSVQAVETFGSQGTHFNDIDSLIKVLKTQLSPDTAVIIKGSRFMRMERVAAAITVTP